MKKISLIMLFEFIILMLLIDVLSKLKLSLLASIIVSVGIAIFSVFFTMRTKKNSKFVVPVCCLNIIASAFLIGGILSYYGWSVSLYHYIIPITIFCMFIVLHKIVMEIYKKKTQTIMFIIGLLLVVIAEVVGLFVMKDKLMMTLILTFTTFAWTILIFTLLWRKSETSYVLVFMISHYFVFILALWVALFIITEGDVGFDFGFSSDKKASTNALK